MNEYVTKLEEAVAELPKDLQDDATGYIYLFIDEVDMGGSIEHEYELACSAIEQLLG